MTSVAWDADAFYCRGSIRDTGKAMVQGFLADMQSKRRADAWRTFCRYTRYVCRSITVRQGTEGAQLTNTEQGHVPVLDTMDGITDIFVLISITLLLNVIDYRQYANTSAPPSVREEEEIRLAQREAWILVVFLAETIDLVKKGTTEPVSVENALFSYLRLQGRWLLWKLRMMSHAQEDRVCHRLSAAEFLQDDRARGIFQMAWKEGTEEEVPSLFTPLDQALGVGFSVPQETSKRKSIGSSRKRPKRRKGMDVVLE